MKIDEDAYLAHYGILRKSGRYPWGSGENPYQRNMKFLQIVGDLRKQGMSEKEIADAFEIKTTQLRQLKTIARNENRAADISQIQRYRDRGWSKTAIGERMGMNESTVRSLLAAGEKDKANVLTTTSNMLKDQVAEKGYIDVGSGVEHHIGVSQTKLSTAVAKLVEEGYLIHYVNVPQLGTGKFTKTKVLGPPGDQKKEWQKLIKDPDLIKLTDTHSDDGGRTFLGLEPPVSIDSKRIKINYAEDGGAEADGVIYVRPGVEDVSLGKSNYAQVRIAVDESHFLKGMAMYKHDLPDGVDLVFNSPKRRNEVESDFDTMKPMKTDKDGNIDPDNPFGAVIKPGGQRGVMNIIGEEGDWSKWSKTLSSQMLSKQSPKLAKTQLDMLYENNQTQLDDIMELTNPAVRRKLLETFADSVDSSAVNLEAARLPKQAHHVILPVNSMKPTEIYAPNYRDGERVVLVRHPHGGIFEIPELTVNNKSREARKLLGANPPDAVAINSKVAERLSGADFDGDTVLVIPNKQGTIKTAPMLEELKDFDPVRTYPPYEGMKRMTPRGKQHEMGDVSNLITDMTIRGASPSELARAVRHSMVVIDAEKKELNYKQSAIDHSIPQLKEKYQGGKRAGASTLISLAGSKVKINERKPRPASEGGPVDKKTGKKVFVETGATYVDSDGNTVTKKEPGRFKRLALTDDASTLSSGTPIEEVYVKHSNRLKNLANKARLEREKTKTIPYSPSAKAAYSEEVDNLNSKLNVAIANRPRERQAQAVANAIVKVKRHANPDMESEEIKKIKNQALAEARTRTGAKKEQIEITPSEWDAIQSGAISNHKLEQILNNADLDQVRELAMPKSKPLMTTAKISRARAMAASGYPQSEIAAALGVSVSTITDAIA